MKILQIFKLSMLFFGIIAQAQDDFCITDFIPLRDYSSVLSMFENDRKVLSYDGNLDDIYSQAQVSKVIRKHNATIGFCSYELWNTSSGYVYHIVVDKDHRRKGYASKMMQYMIDEFAAYKVKSVDLCVSSDNKSALDLYQNKFGFVSAGYDTKKYIVLTRLIGSDSH